MSRRHLRRIGYGRSNRRHSNESALTVGGVVSYVFQSLQLGKQERDISNVRHHKPDYQIVMAMGVLLVLGLIVIYSVGPALSQRVLGDYSQAYFVNRQFINIGVGLVGFIIASQIPLSLWRRLMPLLIGVTLVLTLALFVPGIAITEKGATSWVGMGPLSFQPAELTKLTILFYLAFFLSSKTQEEKAQATKTIIPAAILLALVSLVLVIFQRDLGTMMTVAAIFVGILFMADVPVKYLLGLVGAMFTGAAASTLLFPHRMARLLTFLNPSSDLQGTGYHVQQALIAIGSGGFFGLGLGRSVQAYGYLPEAANDSIFAIWSEKFGFFGNLVMLSLFAFLLYRLYVLIRDLRHDSARLVASGILFWFAGHIIINIGAMIGLLPLTGITLPFLSYGGSSLLMMMVILGIAFHLSRFTERSNESKSKSKINSGSRRARQWSRT